MSSSRGRRFRAKPSLAHQWAPVDGFQEVGPNIWVPEGYERSPWELTQPAVRTDADAEREYLYCRQSLAYFAFHHTWSLHVDDPSGVPQWRKIPAYPYIRRMFDTVQMPSNMHVEKSRQLMVSWCWMVVFLWDILFHDRWSNLVISRRATEVDDGGEHSTFESLLGKMRYLWMSLPPYLQHALVFRMNKVSHVEAGSFVHGETGTQKAGRGSAHKRVLLDEAAYLQKSESIFKAARQVAKTGTILNSTPNGKGNVFWRIRFSATTTFRRMTIHWSEHPVKSQGLGCTCGWRASRLVGMTPLDQFRLHDCENLKQEQPTNPEPWSPWYENECRDLTLEQIGSELDLSYERSRRGRVYSTFDSGRHVIDHQRWVGERRTDETVSQYHTRYLRAALEPNRATICGWDFGVNDPTAICLGQVMDERTMKVRWLDYFEQRDQDWVFYHKYINKLWAPIVREQTGYDLLHYGDPSAVGRDSNLTSWIANLKSKEPRIVIQTGPSFGGVLEWLDVVHSVIRRGDFEVSSWATGLIDMLGNYRYPTTDEGELIPGKQLPVHDEFSHPADAMRYAYKLRWANRLYDQQKLGVSPLEMLESGEDLAALPASF